MPKDTKDEFRPLYYPEDNIRGVPVYLFVNRDISRCSIRFFYSVNDWGTYKSPPTLTLEEYFSNGADNFGFVVDENAVDAFVESVKHLVRKINDNSEYEYDEGPDADVRYLNEDGEDAVEELKQEFEAFVENGDFIDDGVLVVDCEDYWDSEKFEEIYRPGMSYEEFEAAAELAQEEAEEDNFRILGFAEHLVSDAFEELEDAAQKNDKDS